MSGAPELAGQTVVVIGGSSGMGLETARRARTEGADVVLVGRNADRLAAAAHDVGARSTAAFDVTDFERLGKFFDSLPGRIDHIMVTSGGPYYPRLSEIDFDKARQNFESEVAMPLQIARHAKSKVRPGGTLIFMSGTGGRSPGASPLLATFTAGLPALTRSLAVEIAPVRVNLIAAGFVDTPLSAAILGDQLEARREQLRRILPIHRVVGPADVAALAVHLMTNTALTGATFDIDGGQQLVQECP
jgi:NAD(P)-dependent dehydrogenase (short-subunit alcohol dehydrogenase family)